MSFLAQAFAHLGHPQLLMAMLAPAALPAKVDPQISQIYADGRKQGLHVRYHLKIGAICG